MRIERVEGGFITLIENGIVDRVVCEYGKKCTVIFCNRPPKELKIIECSSYQSQFGTPVSYDGSKLFVSSWEKGLYAYDISSGELLWRLKGARMTEVTVYPSYLIVLQSDKAIHKIDFATGQLLATIKTGTVLQHFVLMDSLVLVDSIRGKLSVLDTESMEVVKQYSKKVFNPGGYYSTLIHGAKVCDNQLILCGKEGNHIGFYGPETFQRVIDEHFIVDEDNTRE